MSSHLLSQPVTDPPPADRGYRALVCSWSDLDVASGTPVIICDLLEHFAPGQVEVMTEENIDNKRRRRIQVEQPVYKVEFHRRLWPFTRGNRVRTRLARLGTPLLTLQILRRIQRFQPDCLLAVYAQPHWIMATWLAARMAKIPLIYYVHDTFLEQTKRRQTSAFAGWLDHTALTSARVLVLHPYLADYYRRRYGIESTVLRQIIRHAPLPAHPANRSAAELVIGFSGAIYDNNCRQLADLARIVESDPGLRLKIWSDATPLELQRLGIAGRRVEAAYEPNYERLLNHLAGCDLLYLPLAFFDNPGVTTDSLRYAFPTKSLDYLVCGTPPLVHCPQNFELSQFFTDNACGHVLNDPNPLAVKKWLQSWRAGQVAPSNDSDRLDAIGLFSPEENKRLLWRVIAEEVEHRGVRRSTWSGR